VSLDERRFQMAVLPKRLRLPRCNPERFHPSDTLPSSNTDRFNRLQIQRGGVVVTARLLITLHSG
jgi:hypothetical protein